MEPYTQPLHTLPAGLAEIPEPPRSLWLRGSPLPEHTKFLSIVGSRALSPYGKHVCEYLIKSLAGYPVAVVAGTGLGTDAHVHEHAIDAELHPVAVLNSGITDAAIESETSLSLAYTVMAHGGTLLSEYAPDQPVRTQYPAHTRIMAGLADAVLLLEAGRDSESLLTAQLACDYNRTVLCIPHRITDMQGQGPNSLIRLGATMVFRPEHVLDALGLT